IYLELKIESMKATLERLDMKIDGYEERCLIKEQELFKGNK
ncbi:MerR-family transcriptional regulator, partial [human gut metagenome]